MTVVGFNFTKMMVERTGVAQGKINIKNNISIKSVEETDLTLGKNKQTGIRFVFEFKSVYEPEIGEIGITGEVLYLEEAKRTKEIVKGWEKDKKVPKDIMTAILNTALSRCNVQALILSRDINLPPQIPLPKVEVRTDNYIG